MIPMQSAAEILDELDQQWAAGGCPDLQSLLAQVPANEPELIQELCAADLEWRWRKHADGNLSPGDDSLPAKPIAADYRILLGDQWDDPDCRRNLLEAEWCARSIWGDTPDVDQFATQMPMQADWNSSLARELAALVPLQATLTSRSLKQPISVRVNHDFIVGRQGAGEPKAPAWIAQTARLIVANSHYRVISRDQLRVRRTRLREVELSNISRVIAGTWGDHHLEPGQSARLQLPTSIKVGELEVQLGFDDPHAMDTDQAIQ